ncbi:TIGR02450 family Trp-rich protein [Methylophaga sp.]|uniref:TIGR02450 family Trp-rich protein n=1 Tax=Methylophaga sp. TaxID=2024840 RepID=UPI00345508FF
MLILNKTISSGIAMNRINPAKLHNSKWTAVNPINREKHFLISDIEYDEDGSVISCKLEAIISKKLYSIDWTELKNQEKWIQGWK